MRRKGSESMNKKTISVLVICDAQQYREIKIMLTDVLRNTSFTLRWVSGLSEGLVTLGDRVFDAVLLVCASSRSHGVNDLVMIKSKQPDVPVVVIIESSDAAMATHAVRDGAQDVLVKREVTGNRLARSLLYAIERQQVIRKLQAASLFDDLTGLYNRRGFMNMAGHCLRVAERSKQGISLFYADLDNMKFINDNFGHQAGDQAIITTACLLKGIFRASDIIARIGGDEFVILALNTDAVFAEDILERISACEQRRRQPYFIMLSVGFAYYDPDSPSTIEELLVKADANMYKEKWAKRDENGSIQSTGQVGMKNKGQCNSG